MKLRTKFTLILSITFATGLLVTGFVSYQILFSNAQKEISERAQLMMESAMAMRAYTNANIKPLIKPLMADTFHPESVPSFAAMRSFETLREKHPDYTYREAALNPTNVEHRAVEWENDIISYFRNHEGAKEISGTRATPSGEVMYIARPIQITQQGCLDCHSTPDAAPATVVKAYGPTNGMGWKLNEVVGAQIVAVPMQVTVDRARNTFVIFMAALTGAAALAVVSLNFAMRWLVIRPIVEMSQLCDQVSKGDFTPPDPKHSGDDEISSLSTSFVRMKNSLAKAMKMLEE